MVELKDGSDRSYSIVILAISIVAIALSDVDFSQLEWRSVFILLCISISILFYYFLRWYWKKCEQPALFYSPNDVNQRILSACNVIKERYYPTFWLLNPHLNVIFTELVRKGRGNTFIRDYINLRDGGSACLDWFNDIGDCPKDSPILILLHGVSGGSHSTYVNQLGHYMTTVIKNKTGQQWRPVIYVRRGCGVNKFTSLHPYTYVNTDDMRTVVNFIRNKYPNAPLYGVGFSMGANTLCKYAAEEGENCPLKAIANVCGALEVKNLSKTDYRVSHRYYHWSLCRMIKKKIYKKYAEFASDSLHPSIDKIAVEKAVTIREFDMHFTTKVLGYESVDHYYDTQASAFSLRDIKIPTFFLQALDDPIVIADHSPFLEVFENLGYPKWPENDYAFKVADTPNMILCVTRIGGHLGYMEGLLPFHYNFADRAISDYLIAVHDLFYNKS